MTTLEHTCTLDSPVGPLNIGVADDALSFIHFTDDKTVAGDTPVDGNTPTRQGDLDNDPVLAATTRQLQEYFAGVRTEFDLPLRPGGTRFQQQVWAMLAEIPYGETWTYGELATQIGSPNAFRAVGAANGQNPLPIVLPCHRVVGSNGKLVGYGGGMNRKRVLLELEAKVRLQRDFG